jgi:hypothetical protein
MNGKYYAMTRDYAGILLNLDIQIISATDH